MLAALLALVLNAMALPLYAELPVSGNNAPSTGYLGPFEAANGNLYQVVETSETRGNVFMQASIDGGATWSVLDFANGPKLTNDPDPPRVGTCRAKIVGDKIYVLLFDAQQTNTNGGKIGIFDTTTGSGGSWIAPITGLPSAGGYTGRSSFDPSVIDSRGLAFCVMDNGDVFLFTNMATSPSDDTQSAIYYFHYINGSGWVGGATPTANLVPGQAAGFSYVPVDAIVTPAANVYLVMTRWPFSGLASIGVNFYTGNGSLLYSKNFLAPVMIAQDALPWTFAAGAVNGYLSAYNNPTLYWGAGIPCLWSGTKIAIPFLGGNGQSLPNPQNPYIPPAYAPTVPVMLATISGIDGAETVTTETIDASTVVFNQYFSFENILGATARTNGDLFVTGNVPTSLGPDPNGAGAQVAYTANVVYWRKSATWDAPVIVFDQTCVSFNPCSSGAIPLVFSGGTKLGVMVYHVSVTTAGFPANSGGAHAFGSVPLPVTAPVNNPGPAGRRPIVLIPNRFDHCLHREYRLFCNIDYDAKGCARLPKCFTVDEREWGDPV